MKYVSLDLNADAGESFGNFKYGNDDELIPLLTSVNIACGFHAGDPSVIRKTVRLALENNVAIGAHIGLPDLLGFGRRILNVSPDEMRDYTVYQVAALQGFIKAEGGTLHHVGPHGVLAQMCIQNPGTAEAFAEGIHSVAPDAKILGRPGLVTFDAARKLGHEGACQVGVDIDYRANRSSVVQRIRKPWPVERALQRLRDIVLKGSFPAADTGEPLDFEVQSILVHSDTPNAVELMTAVREELKKLNVEAKTF